MIPLLTSYSGADVFVPTVSDPVVPLIVPDFFSRSAATVEQPELQGTITANLVPFSGVTVFDPLVNGQDGTITQGATVYSGATVQEPDVGVTLALDPTTYSGATVENPTLEAIAAVALLDAWLDQGTGVSLAAPGSRALSAGTDRLFLAHVSTAGTTTPVTALSWGGQAMTLVDSEASTGGRDLDTAVFRLEDADIAAAVGDAFIVTPDSGGVSFRMRTATYQNVDQTTPVLDSFNSTSVGQGDDPVSQSLTTAENGIAIAAVSINRGQDDAGTEDVSYTNLTERVEDNASTGQYSSVADANTDGTDFTPTLTTTQTNGRVHLIGLTLQLSPGADNVSPGVTVYSGATVQDVTLEGSLALDLTTYSGATVEDPALNGSLELDLTTYSGATVEEPAVNGSIEMSLTTYSGATVEEPTVRLWVPSDIADLHLHLDAQDAGSITDTAGEVSQWDDLSASGIDISQATAAQQPNTSTANGNDSIQFDGGDRLLATGLGDDLDPDDMTFITVITPDDAAGNEDYAGFYNVGNFTRQGIRKTGSTVQLFIFGTASSTTPILLGAVAGVTRWQIFRAESATNGGTDALDSSGITATNAGTDTALGGVTQFSLGATPTGATAYSGHIHEVIVYDRRVTDEERDLLEGYLNGRWTLS